MKLPRDKFRRQRIEDYIEDAKQDFPGMILDQWGHQWLSLDFLGEEEAALYRELEEAEANS